MEDPSTQIEFKTGTLSYGMVDVGINPYGVRKLTRGIIELKEVTQRLRRFCMEKNLDDETLRYLLESHQKNISALELALSEISRAKDLKETTLGWHKQVIEIQNQHKSELRERIEAYYHRLDQRLIDCEDRQEGLVEFRVKVQTSLDTLNFLVVVVPSGIAAIVGIVAYFANI
ncbi:hypothetical protein PJF56_18200 [Roseofilum sp. BLCC_M91]|uniref:Uncharacterized protein n=1 Tax=Roseofilum halophilum BLCC-M91 TaxID=3022259 RepID=A0ABT7BNL8_9CYAN|nr:hypothetical protein [Roseofilum halophilum]MDJ1180795.1 hypothetical protein [Roseofilum halophilum BLCC-M91]